MPTTAPCRDLAMSVLEFTGYREGGVIRPWGEASWNDFMVIPERPKHCQFVVRQPRNIEHHNKYRLILQRAAATDPEYHNDPDGLAEWVKVRLRMFKEFDVLPDGRVRIVTESTSVYSMDQIKFNLFYERAMMVLGERLGIDPEALLDDRSQSA